MTTKPKPNPGIGPEHHTPKYPQPAKEPHGALCTATAKSTGERCQHYAMHGGTVCNVHGGLAPQVRAKAARRLEIAKVEAEVTQALTSESLVGVADPLAALSMLAAEALANKKALGVMVNKLGERLRYSATGAGTEQLRAEVQLYERAMDRSAKFLDLLVKSGFEEKRIAVMQASTLIASRVLDRIFNGLDLSARQRELIGVVVPNVYREIGIEEAKHHGVG